MHIPLWIFIGVCGAVVLLVSGVKRRRGRRGPVLIGLLGALIVAVVIVGAVRQRVQSRSSYVSVDWPSWPNVVLPPRPPNTNHFAQTIWIDELRESLATWKAESKEAASGVWEQAHAEIDRVYQSIVVESIVVEDGDGLSIVLPPRPGKEVLAFQWDRPKDAPRAPPAVGEGPRHRRTPDIKRGTVIWNVLAGLVVAGFLFVGYVLLDAATRGQFTGQLRFLSVVAVVSAACALLFA